MIDVERNAIPSTIHEEEEPSIEITTSPISKINDERVGSKSPSTGPHRDSFSGSFQLSPRSAAKPRRVRSSGSNGTPRSSLRSSSGGGGLMSIQLMSGSVSQLDCLNLEDLPHHEKTNKREQRPRRRERSEAIERLHSSMTALEGISPEDLLQEVNRRRTERQKNKQQQQRLAASMPAATREKLAQAKFYSSMPAITKNDNNESLNFEPSISSDQKQAIVEQPQQHLGTVSSTSPTSGAVIQTRDNSNYLWQVGVECFGALEVACKLEWDYRAPLEPRYVNQKEEAFDHCLKVWKTWKLADEFVKACEAVPPWSACCGMIRDDDRTMQDTAKALRKGWIKNVNQRLKAQQEIFKIDVYLWSWHNATGKAKTSILLIRFLQARR